MAFCVRLARGLVYLLETKTKDGYVFRTDLRLRPHLPGHPLALSTDAAELYYERHGQNWERAALIKARAVAGDVVAGDAFLQGAGPVHLAQAPRLRGDPRHPVDQAADQRLSRLRHDPGARPRPQGRPRRHPRDRVLRPDPAADPGRPRCRRCAWRRPAPRLPTLASRRWVDEARSRELTAAYRLLRRWSTGCRWWPTGRPRRCRTASPTSRKFAAFAGFADPRRARAAGAPDLAHRRAPLRGPVRARARSGGRRQPRVHRHRRRSGDAARRWPTWASRTRRRSPAASAPGITATSAPPAARGRASC